MNLKLNEDEKRVLNEISFLDTDKVIEFFEKWASIKCKAIARDVRQKAAEIAQNVDLHGGDVDKIHFHIMNIKEEEEEVKTKTIEIFRIHRSDLWHDLVYELKFDAFKAANPDLVNEADDNELLNETFSDKEISSRFVYGEVANIQLTFNSNLEVIDGGFI